jgi:hypothetical protein
MDQELKTRLDQQDELLKEVFRSSERMRKYFLWSLILGLAFFILPMIGLLFAIPYYLKTLDISGLGL